MDFNSDDSDDEMINALDTFRMTAQQFQNQNCIFCDKVGANIPCSMCNLVVYCSNDCLRRHFPAHRKICISSCVKDESEEEEESETDSDSETDSEDDSKYSRGTNANRQTLSNGLSEAQVNKLIKLASKSGDSEKQMKLIRELENKIGQLMVEGGNAKEAKGGGIGGGVKVKEIRSLQAQIKALERRAASGGFSGSTVNLVQEMPPVYEPLLVSEDPKFKKYFKLKGMNMSVDQIKIKMEKDGLDPQLLDKPESISPNDPGPSVGAYVPLKIGEDPKFRKYFKLKDMHMPLEQILMKMEVDGVDPSYLDKPNDISPNDPGPKTRTVTQSAGQPFSLIPGFPPSIRTTVTSNHVPLLVKDDPEYQKYFKLMKLGMPKEQVKLKMQAEAQDLNADFLDTPDEISPNDKISNASSAPMINMMPAEGMSMQSLFQMVMQHQQTLRTGSESIPSNGNPNVSLKDQMAMELAEAENAVEDLFGDEVKVSSSGSSMVQQLSKQARKEQNKKLVENRGTIVSLIDEVLNAEFESDENAISFYKQTAPKLEELGLSLGTDQKQTWSSRLLIKNKETKDWYFSEEEREDAGNAYARLWSLSFLTTTVSQLNDKKKQIINAPDYLKSVKKSKSDLLNTFTSLLKETVKLRHKIFNNRVYKVECEAMDDLGIPQRIEEIGQELLQSTAILANAAINFADEEIKNFDKTTKAKKIKAIGTVNIGEKSIQLVGIVKKLGCNIPEESLVLLQERVRAIKEEYITIQEEGEEDDDDVL